MTLPPYNPSAKCVKCGSDVIETEYHRGDGCYSSPCPRTLPAIEHLLRDCIDCGFEWLEAPMDAGVRPFFMPTHESITRNHPLGQYVPPEDAAPQSTKSLYCFVRYEPAAIGGPRYVTPLLRFRDMTEAEAQHVVRTLYDVFKPEWLKDKDDRKP